MALSEGQEYIVYINDETIKKVCFHFFFRFLANEYFSLINFTLGDNDQRRSWKANGGLHS